MKMHHCIADGIATMHMLSALCDAAENDSYDDAIHAAKTPDRERPTSARLSINPIDWYRGAWRLASDAASATVEIAGGTLAIINGLVRAGTPSALNGPIGSMRRYSAVWVPLADVAIICDAFGVTINDVALAAITDSYRAALIRRGSDPRADSLRTLVPVSVRPPTAIDKADNRVSVMLPYLPVDEPDPTQQLRTVHRRMARVKSSGQRQAASTLVSAMNMVPSAVTAWTVRALTRLPQRGVVTLATNVPGPRRRLRVMERQLLHLLPMSPVALRLRTGIATLTYADEVAFGITADFDTASDVDELAGGIEQAVCKLAAAAQSQSQGSST
jgi:diacylglycerol O-acyltransferase